MHPRGPVPPHARDKGAENLDSMVDISPNPLDPPVALGLCARRIDYLAGDSGSLLIGTSANSVVMVVLREHLARDYNAEVLLEGHTGHLRAIATVPAASFCFSVSLEVLEQDQAVVAIKEDVGHDVKNVALKMFPSLEDTTHAGFFLQQGRLIVTRYQHQNKTWFCYDPFGRGGGEFVEQVCTHKTLYWYATHSAHSTLLIRHTLDTVLTSSRHTPCTLDVPTCYSRATRLSSCISPRSTSTKARQSQ